MTSLNSNPTWRSMPARPIALMGLIVSLFVIPRLSFGQQADPPPAKGFLEIAHDPKASAAQKKTISAVNGQR